MTLRSPDTADNTGTIDSGAGHRGTPPGDTQGNTDKDAHIAMSLGELRRSGKLVILVYKYMPSCD